jgi:Kdo2-lipid IVA lauroyltransferase/acyltransferase
MIGRSLKPALDATTGALTVAVLRGMRGTERKHTANFAGALMRKFGPLLKEHRVGRDNLRAAFAEKSEAEIEKILSRVWDNLGRMAVEFAHLEEFCIEGFGAQTPDVIRLPVEARVRCEELTKSGRPIIAFAGHYANWELAGLAAKCVGMKSAVLYRRPNIRAIGDVIVKLRSPLMGELVPTTLDAPVKLARLLQSGISVGIVADQHYTKGVEVTFFGRKCLANPLVAMLARQTETPIHGVRVVRNTDGNSFWGEITPQVDPVRDSGGRVDIQGTTQVVTSMIEGWIRERPEQWLWLHRRWR